MIYTAAGFNSSFSFTNIPTATGHDLRQLLDPLLKLVCFPLDYFVVQTLDQDIVECVRDYGLWAEQPVLADIVNAEDTGNPLKVSETYRPHCMQVKPLADTVVDVIAFASTADHQRSLAAQIGRPAVRQMMKTETSLQADMKTSKKLLEEVSRKMDVCLSNLHALLKGSRQVYAVIHQFSGLLKFRNFCLQGNHDTPLICTLLGTLQGEGRGEGLG